MSGFITVFFAQNVNKSWIYLFTFQYEKYRMDNNILISLTTFLPNNRPSNIFGGMSYILVLTLSMYAKG